MTPIDAAFAVMLALGIAAKVSGIRGAVQAYLIIANAALAWWFWVSEMPLTTLMFAASAAVAAHYTYQEMQSR